MSEQEAIRLSLHRLHARIGAVERRQDEQDKALDLIMELLRQFAGQRLKEQPES